MDNLSPNYTELCLKAKILHEDLQLNLAQIGQVVLAITTLFLLIFSIRTYKRKKHALHYNFMLLINNIVVLYVVHSIGMIVINLRYQIPLLLNSEPCQFLTAIWINILLRLYSYIYLTAYILFHVALSIERARATIFARRYEKENSSYAILCIVIVWVLTAVINGYMVILAMQDKEFMEKPSIIITITTESSANYLVWTNYCFLAIIVITATIDYFLLRTNRKNKSKDVDYSLSRSYQINENIIVMKLLWPLDVCFAVLFAVYLSGAIFLRLFRDKFTLAQYSADYTVIQLVLPIHSIITLLLYLNFAKNSKTRIAAVVESGDHANIHFKQLESQWITMQKRTV